MRLFLLTTERAIRKKTTSVKNQVQAKDKGPNRGTVAQCVQLCFACLISDQGEADAAVRFGPIYDPLFKRSKNLEEGHSTRFMAAKLETHQFLYSREIRCRHENTADRETPFCIFRAESVAFQRPLPCSARRGSVVVHLGPSLAYSGGQFSVRHIHGSARSALACSSRFN
jgi:hypothetical protein